MLGRLQKSYIIYLGNRNKTQFLDSLNTIIDNIPNKKINMDVISMSGKKFFSDQLLSLFSFYYNVGLPHSWTIFSDGTYTENELAVFSKIPGVFVKDINIDKYEEEIAKFPTLKKMFLLQNIIPDRPTIFTDSDVLFFTSFTNQIEPFLFYNCYLVDEGKGYFDEFIPNNVSLSMPLNLGVLLLNKKPNWKIAWDYIEQRILNKEIHYWTDQTATHIMALEDGFVALPKNEFIVGGKDAFSVKDIVDYKKISLRHFVGPIRHKMWQHKWQNILNCN